MIPVIILVLFLIFTLGGLSIALSMGLSVLFYALLTDIPLSFLAQTAYTSLDNYAYIAIPLFVLVGNLMESGGLSKRLINFSSSILVKVPGSLGSINVLSCAFFGAICGSASATTAAIGGMTIPEMKKNKYPVGYSGAISAVAGTLGAIIPPSIVMIIYAVVAEVSVSDMFIAGFLPGIIITVGLILFNTIFCMIKKVDTAHSDDKLSIKNIIGSFWEAKWALLSPIIILGGIYTGVFTATEAASIATIYSLIVGVFIHREIKIRDLIAIFWKSAKTAGAVLIIIPFASTLAKLLTLHFVPQRIGAWVLSFTNNPVIILLIMVLLVFISGMFLDATPLILIYTPLFLPILKTMGTSPIHFGIILTLGAMIGAVTPPVGMNLYIAQGIEQVNTLQIMKYATYFIVVFIVLYVTITLNPWISSILLSILK